MPRRLPRPSAVLAPLVMALALVAPALPGQAYAHHRVDPEVYVEALLEAAPGLAFIEQGELAFGRHDGRSAFRATDLARQTAFAAALQLQSAPDRLLALLERPEGEDSEDAAKVRLLAAYALYRTADPRYLPQLGAATTDDGEIRVMPAWSFALDQNLEPIPKLDRDDLPSTTVGQEIAGWLTFGWNAPDPGGEEFAPWCEMQVELAPTAVALRLQMTLTTGGSLTSGSWSLDALSRIHRETLRAPKGAREIALLGLFHDRYQFVSHELASGADTFVIAARRLGADHLLAYINGEPISIGGETIASERIEGFEDGVRAFVLAQPLACGLREKHADQVLQLARRELHADAFVAAARLRPSAAAEILREGMRATESLFSSNLSADIAIALYELGDEEHTSELSDWFHGDSNGTLFPYRKRPFVSHLLRNGRPRDHVMLRSLIEDERFDRCHPSALQMILYSLEERQFEPIVPPDWKLNFRHPFGTDRAWADLASAREAWPAETAAMEDRMKIWRERIRAHVADW